MTTLLKKALEFRVQSRKRHWNDEEIELAIAWMKDEISMTQVLSVLPGGTKNRGNFYTYMSMALRQAYRQGKIIQKLEVKK